jgi:hypothetical protein
VDAVTDTLPTSTTIVSVIIGFMMDTDVTNMGTSTIMAVGHFTVHSLGRQLAVADILFT